MEPTINTLNIAADPTPNSEQIIYQTYGIYPEMEEKDFNVAVRQRIIDVDAQAGKIRLADRQKTNYEYWRGNQVDVSSLRDDLEKQSENVILRNLETIIPIATSRVPELSVTPQFKNDKTRGFAMNVRSMMRTEWDVVQMMQQELSRGIRNHQITFLGIVMMGFDPDTNEFWSKEIVATDCKVSKNGDFLARYIKDQTVGDLIKKFPDKKDAILGNFKMSDKSNKELFDSPAEYLEVWTDTTVGWILNDLTLGLMKNPHWDYTGKTISQSDPNTGAVTNYTVKFNHLKKMRMPFIFMNYLNRGVSVYDDTTLVEQAIGPQDWINKRKRQIGMNADTTNGHWVSSGDFISREEFSKIEGGIDEKIWLQNGLPANGIQKITGQPLPEYIYTDLIDSRNALDNLMGTHSTTRGEKSQNDTLGQDIMQKNQDYGRIDGYARDVIEKFAKQWFDYMYHLYCVYRTEETSIAIPEDDDFETDNIVFSQDKIPLIQTLKGEMIPVPLLFKIKQGSTLPEDDLFTFSRAEKMKDRLSTIDYFKMLGLHNPKELYKNKLIEAIDPFHFVQNDPDIKDIQQKIALQKQAQAQGMKAAQDEQNKTEMTKQLAGTKTNPQAPAGEGSSHQGVLNAMVAMIQQGQVDPKALQGGGAPAAQA